MHDLLDQRLAALFADDPGAHLGGGRKGLEKESLRIEPDGRLSRRPHPGVLGSPLTHPYITTDFSEALMELVTPPFAEAWETLQFLCDLHQFVYENLGDELLWATSMPCIVSGDGDIPLARYGSSNVGIMKTVYRRGLGYRYGRAMQAIAGVHFNYSLPEAFWPVYRAVERSDAAPATFRSTAYFELLRNFRRYGWIVLYLFGSSPAVCKSFVRGQKLDLSEFDAGTLYEPYATSLRMSDLGYRNATQKNLAISLNGMDEYVADLTRAITTPHPDYQRIGVVVNGEHRQLNANVLQIENEYYSLIRPKRVARSGERPTQALRRDGVEYVELRALDVSAFDPVGANGHELRFLECLLIFCLLRDSPQIGADEQAALDANHLAVAHRGRDPALRLVAGDRRRPLRDWALEILDRMQGPCEALDAGDAARPYQTALEMQRRAVEQPELTPSARILAGMRDAGLSFFEFALQMSQAHKSYFLSLGKVREGRREAFREAAASSIAQQRCMEAADDVSFEEHLRRYFA
ncbi:MAG TPA: glutamate--cysteine ligase [Gammaproteobacteria bacterium]|nr:glutamate--cysteine ligase [Gammaproteobacteria bacterium]